MVQHKSIFEYFKLQQISCQLNDCTNKVLEIPTPFEIIKVQTQKIPILNIICNFYLLQLDL